MRKGMYLFVALLAVISLGFGLQSTAYAQGAVAGRVIDADGNAVAGAQVAIMQMINHRGDHRPFQARAETGEDGTFGFRQVPAGNYMVEAGAREIGHAAARAVVNDDQVTEVELQLAGRGGGGGDNGGGDREIQFGSISGTVIDADGNGIANARVIIQVVMRGENDRRNARRVRNASVMTDENGAFTFEHVPAGNVTLGAMARGFRPTRTRAEVAAEQNTEVEITLQAARGGRGGGN